MSGPVSLALEQEILGKLRRDRIVVWLDKDGAYTPFVDDLSARGARGEFPFPVVGFRGSFLELLFKLEPFNNGLDEQPLLVHMPGFNRASIRKTPVLELYEPGLPFEKSLDTLIREAATSRVAPAEVEAFVDKAPSLEEADAWIASASSQSSFGLAAILAEVGPKMVAEALAQPDSLLAARVTGSEEARRFAHGTNACIVCTSTLELGIDVGDLDAVFQANAPSSVSSFLQRMGRTGRRAGTTANTSFFCEDPEAVLQAVALIELAREGWVERVARPERCWPVLVHQLLAMTLQFGAISADRCWEQLARVPDFRSISRGEFDAVVEHMKKEDFLFEAGGLLSMGTKAEKRFGKKNFLELYAVFSSPVLYRVVTHAKRDVGSLEQDFVDRLVEQMSSFLLGGRAWTVDRVSHEDREVVVREAPRGVKPSWGGFLPQHLGFEVAQRMKRVLMETTRYPYVDEAGFKHLEAKRDDLGELLRRLGPAVQIDGAVARWWTFAGGRVNHTLKYGFEVLEGWKVVPDNFQLRIEGDGVGHESVRAAIARMTTATFWNEPDTRRAVLARLPDYRLTKFQDCLPETFALEVIERYLLDIEGTVRWLGGAATS